jgi:L-histidine N-alpha-methyltransferase
MSTIALDPTGERFRMVATRREEGRSAFARAVRAGLSSSPKLLPCRYFYDARGSELFEKICQLPEYYLTRAEQEILQARASEIVAALPAVVDLVELGSGSAEKTRLLIAALLNRQASLRYIPIDISGAALEKSSRRLLADYPTLDIHAVAAEYREGLQELERPAERSRLLLWLGSNVGNYHREEAARFLQQVRLLLGPTDRLLLGVDLRKDRVVLERAYDDAAGVTAQFNLNLLHRINRELSGQFRLEDFRHRAIYREVPGRIEMHLISNKCQKVAIDRLHLQVEFAEGESIHTENSYKYSLAEIETLATQAGFELVAQWFDGQRLFSTNLLAAR